MDIIRRSILLYFKKAKDVEVYMQYNEYKNSNFFFIDSDCLNEMKTRLCGYAIGPEEKLDNLDFADNHPNGSYILIQASNGMVRITQDYTGNYSLYLFKRDNYFAISNSFLLLVEKIKDRFLLTMNYEYANALLVAGLSPLSASETLIKEISVLPRECKLVIDKKEKTLSIEKVEYKEHTISIDSKEAMDILDNWFAKWISIIQELKRENSAMSVDLSGGFDSRLVFMLFLASGIDLDRVRIASINDELHTHIEDYQIASRIADFYKLKLNTALTVKRVPCGMNEAVSNSFYAKLGVHKQMYWKPFVYAENLFRFSGSGGESIRGLWHKKPSQLISEQKKRGERYKNVDVSNSVDKIMTKAYAEAQEKYKIENKESEELTQLLYRDTRCRHHFGKATVEDIYANMITCTPLMDLELSKITLDVSEDPDLLVALLFIRYCPQLLEFEFEGGRSISAETIYLARQICEKYGIHKVVEKKNIITKSYFNERKLSTEETVDKNAIEQFIFKFCEDKECVDIISTYFDIEILYYAIRYAKSADYHRLQELYAVVAICIIQCMVCESKKNVKKDLFQRLIFSEQNVQPLIKHQQATFTYLFPFDKVPMNSKIVLYGAGEVGNLFYKQLVHSDYCDVVCWCDRNYELLSENIENPNRIYEKDYNYIIIAIANQKIASEIVNDLTEKGIQPKKIIWGNYRVDLN